MDEVASTFLYMNNLDHAYFNKSIERKNDHFKILGKA